MDSSNGIWMKKSKLLGPMKSAHMSLLTEVEVKQQRVFSKRQFSLISMESNRDTLFFFKSDLSVWLFCNNIILPF